MPDLLPRFRYSEPTVTVGPYLLDASALNAYIARAESAFGQANVVYDLAVNAYGDPSKTVSDEDLLELDCSGYAWWSTYRSRKSAIWDEDPEAGWSNHWAVLPYAIPGAVVRYGAPAGKSHGHVGVVIANKGGTFQTLDSSDSSTPPRKGAIRYTPDGKDRWYKGPDTRFVVSREAILEINGKPVARPLNIWLAAAKRPILSTVLLLAIAAGAWSVYRKRKGLPIIPEQLRRRLT